MSKKLREPIGEREMKSILTHLREKRENIAKSEKKSVQHSLHKLDNIIKAFTLLFHTGVRAGELTKINTEMIKEATINRFFYNNQQKVHRERKIFISIVGVEDFKNILENTPQDGLILRRYKTTKGYKDKYLVEMLNKVIHEALGERYTSHSFRHGLLREMLLKGYKTVVVQKFAGHKNANTTERYLVPSDDDILSAIDSVR
jgi:integrase/recombinase XerD